MKSLTPTKFMAWLALFFFFSFLSQSFQNVPEKWQVGLLALLGIKFGDSFVCSRRIEDDKGPDRTSRARLPAFRMRRACVFPDRPSPQQWGAANGHSGAPELPRKRACPPPRLPDAGCCSRRRHCRGLFRTLSSVPWRRLLLLAIFSFVYILVYLFNYTHSKSRLSIGVSRS